MKIKWGALVTDGRGKIGGQVASKNRSGAYMRNKVTPSNPQTAAQSGVRARLASYSSAWRALTQAQRDAWNAAVASFSRTNVFGDIVNPTGKNLYTGLNQNLVNIGESAISVPPAVAAVEEPTISSVAFEDATVAADVTIELDSANSAQHYLVFASEQVSQGVGYFKNKYRQLAVHDGSSGTTIDITTEYEARFGTPVVGQKASFKVVPVVTASGQAGVGAAEAAIAIASS